MLTFNLDSLGAVSLASMNPHLRMVGTLFVVSLAIMIFLSPLVAYVWWVAVAKPKRGRKMQEAVWQPIASQLGGTFTPSTGGARFHGMAIPRYGTLVTVMVIDRAAIDPEIKDAVYGLDPGGWRTFVQANVVGRGPAFVIHPRHGGRPGIAVGDPHVQQDHHVTALLSSSPDAVGSRFTHDVCQSLAALGKRYHQLAAGPTFVSLELPGICADRALLEAAIGAVGGIAGYAPYPATMPAPNGSKHTPGRASGDRA